MQERWQRYKVKSIRISSIRCGHQVHTETVHQQHHWSSPLANVARGNAGVRMLGTDRV